MFALSSSSTLVFWSLALLRIIIAQSPPGFQPSSTNHLFVTYGQISVLPAGLELTPAQAHLIPTIGTATALNGTYILLVVDPDAPSRNNTSLADVIQWTQPDLTSTSSPHATIFPLISTSPAVVPYSGPVPPPHSGSHRYIFLLFKQPGDFTVPASFAGFNPQHRTNFDLSEFLHETGLEQVVAANYYVSQPRSSTVRNTTGGGGNGTTGTGSNGTPITFRGGASGALILRLDLLFGIIVSGVVAAFLAT